MEARSWGRFKDKLYFGNADGKVYEAGVGHQDGTANIDGDVQTAFNYLETAHDKRLTLARPLVEANGTVQVTISSAVDFAPHRMADNSPTSIVTDGTPWATATKATGRKWATTSKPTGNKWAAGAVQLRSWQTLDKIGTALSIRLQSSTRGANVSLFATDVVYEKAQGIM